MNRFLALIKKEIVVLSKDLHGLFVLFVMPAIFILIMSLAMQDSFDEHSNVSIEYALVDNSNSALSQQLKDQLKLISALNMQEIKQDQFNTNQLKHDFSQDTFKFALILEKDFSQQLFQGNAEQNEQDSAIKVYIAPTVKPNLRRFFSATLRSELIRLKIAATLAQSDDEEFAPSMDAVEKMSKVDINQAYLYQDGMQQENPTAVQQSVPAWLVFAMFFVVVPLSTAFIIERQQGTFLRLRMMNVYPTSLLSAKIVPYYFVNQIQMLLMVLVGMFIVPMLGGNSLNGPSSILGLAIISSATSIAAICFALFISVFAKTTIQATTLGGISNIIFGALGGIMVPKFIMPTYMQEIATVSPMSWGLEGFLDVFLRNADWTSVIPESTSLLIFAIICLGIATTIFNRQGVS